MKVIGKRPSSFKGDDGTTITGINFYLTCPMDEPGEGEASERIFLMDKRMKELGYEPEVGDEVKPEYNRYGKCSALIPLE